MVDNGLLTRVFVLEFDCEMHLFFNPSLDAERILLLRVGRHE